MSVVASVSFLNQLYTSLCSISVPGYTNFSVQSYIVTFLNTPNNSINYSNMVGAINAWLSSTTIPQTAAGLLTGTDIHGLRVQVIEADGVTLFDSNAGDNNIFQNINIPKSTFLTDGKYLINENQNVRSYNMGATLSQSGVFSQQKFSKTTGTNQIYLSVRQGISSSHPIGNIVVSMNVQ
jgi:hypothetical protein